MEETVICPYNPSHTILKSRLQFHLTRCRTQHPKTDTLMCPFNSTHVVPVMEIEVHQMVCDKRASLDAFMTNISESDSQYPLNNIPLPQPEEEWDMEMNEVSVLDCVRESLKQKKVLVNIVGAPKSQRKEHRLKERRRFQMVSRQNPYSDSSSKPESHQNVEQWCKAEENSNKENQAKDEMKDFSTLMDRPGPSGCQNDLQKAAIISESSSSDDLSGAESSNSSDDQNLNPSDSFSKVDKAKREFLKVEGYSEEEGDCSNLTAEQSSIPARSSGVDNIKENDIDCSGHKENVDSLPVEESSKPDWFSGVDNIKKVVTDKAEPVDISTVVQSSDPPDWFSRLDNIKNPTVVEKESSNNEKNNNSDVPDSWLDLVSDNES